LTCNFLEKKLGVGDMPVIPALRILSLGYLARLCLKKKFFPLKITKAIQGGMAQMAEHLCRRSRPGVQTLVLPKINIHTFKVCTSIFFPLLKSIFLNFQIH
jgi:hypothetical protein